MYYQDQFLEIHGNAQTHHSHRSSHHNSSHSHISRPASSYKPPASGYRPPSELLCDLHVYKVPSELWRESFNNILNSVVTETVSVGIIRVPIDIRLVDIREEIVQQLQLDDLLPRDFVFLRSVGRSLTRLRGKQEYQLKAKHFLPPVAYAPELYILEATPEIRDALAISDRSSQSPPLSRRTSPSHRGYPPNTYRNGYPGDSDTERDHKSYQPASPANKYKPLPQIDAVSSRSRDPYNQNQSLGRNPYDQNQSPGRDPYNRNQPYGRDPYNRNQSPGRDPYNRNQSPGRDPYNRDESSRRDPYSRNADPHNDPYNSHADNKNDCHTQQQNKPPDGHYSEKAVKDWDEQPENKQAVAVYHAAVHPTRDRNPSPHKQSPPRSAEKGRDRRHDDDSGVAGLTPEDDYNRRNKEEYDNLRKQQDMQPGRDSERFMLDNETEEERRRRLEDLERQNYMDSQRWNADQEDRRRQADEDRRRKEEVEKRRKEEQEKMAREEEDQKRREEIEKQSRNEVERRKREEAAERRRQREEQEKREEEERLKKLKEDANRFSSPEARQDSPSEMESVNRDTESARQRRRDEKNQLLKDIEDARGARQNQEKEREELVKKAKQMQHKTTNRRNEARDMWKKKYFEEKKKTAPLEENSNRLRNELDALHRRLMNTLEGRKEKNLKLIDTKPSEKNNYVIQCTKLQHEIEDVQRRVENARMKLTSEMKLRAQAQTEMKAVKAEAMQNRLALKMARQGNIGMMGTAK